MEQINISKADLRCFKIQELQQNLTYNSRIKIKLTLFFFFSQDTYDKSIPNFTFYLKFKISHSYSNDKTFTKNIHKIMRKKVITQTKPFHLLTIYFFNKIFIFFPLDFTKQHESKLFSFQSLLFSLFYIFFALFGSSSNGLQLPQTRIVFMVFFPCDHV